MYIMLWTLHVSWYYYRLDHFQGFEGCISWRCTKGYYTTMLFFVLYFFFKIHQLQFRILKWNNVLACMILLDCMHVLVLCTLDEAPYLFNSSSCTKRKSLNLLVMYAVVIFEVQFTTCYQCVQLIIKACLCLSLSTLHLQSCNSWTMGRWSILSALVSGDAGAQSFRCSHYICFCCLDSLNFLKCSCCS